VPVCYGDYLGPGVRCHRDRTASSPPAPSYIPPCSRKSRTRHFNDTRFRKKAQVIVVVTKVYNPLMPIIEARSLAKTFWVKRKETGLRGSLKSVARPEFRHAHAVRGVTFSLEPGELLAFIGPNRAGKSTTIKMLTGILCPTSGEAQVLGLTPWRDRRTASARSSGSALNVNV